MKKIAIVGAVFALVLASCGGGAPTPGTKEYVCSDGKTIVSDVSKCPPNPNTGNPGGNPGGNLKPIPDGEEGNLEVSNGTLTMTKSGYATTPVKVAVSATLSKLTTDGKVAVLSIGGTIIKDGKVVESILKKGMEYAEFQMNLKIDATGLIITRVNPGKTPTINGQHHIPFEFQGKRWGYPLDHMSAFSQQTLNYRITKAIPLDEDKSPVKQ